MMVIPLDASLLAHSSSLPGSGAGHAGCFPIWPCCGWGLPCLRPLPDEAVRSYRTLSPLPDSIRRSALCGTFPGSPPPDVIRHPYPVQPGLSSTDRKNSLPRPSGPLRRRM